MYEIETADGTGNWFATETAAFAAARIESAAAGYAIAVRFNGAVIAFVGY